MTDRHDKLTQFIDLKINGRMLPSWVGFNYKKYKLEEILKKPGTDPCGKKTDSGEMKLELRKYQLFVSQFLDYRSIYRSILIYGGLGSIFLLSRDDSKHHLAL
jgi:hypothetical protein